jgi:hypothetical protein
MITTLTLGGVDAKYSGPVIPHSAESQVVRLFKDILATLRAGCAHAESKNPRKGITDVAFVPTNDRAAKFGAVFFDEDLYAVFFGGAKRLSQYESPWEIKLKRSDGSDKQLAVIERMCLAVIAGRCEHRVKRWGVQGTIKVSEKEVYSITDLGILEILRPHRSTEVVKYEPYYPGAESHSRSFPKLSL